MTEPKRRLIISYRNAHHQLQAGLRADCDRRIDVALSGKAFMFKIDGMTEYTGQTPRVGIENYQSKGDLGSPKIKNRTVGVEVYCHGIKTTFVYHLDELVASGANIMIEVVRQAELDLTAMLGLIGHKLPREKIL